MHALFKAHQGLGLYLLQFLVVVEAIRLIWAQTQPPGERAFGWLSSVVIGLVDLQVLMGLILYSLSPRHRASTLTTHLVLGILAAVAFHVSKKLESYPRVIVYLSGTFLVFGTVYLGLMT